MTQQTDLIAVLKSTLTVPVYSDFVPEAQVDTAVSLINLGSPAPLRTIDGKKIGKKSHWRITVVSKVSIELDSVIEEIESLDNKRVTGFQKILVDNTLLEPKDVSDPFKRAFITVTVYK